MIASSMTAGGGLHLVDTVKKTAAPFFPASAKSAHDKTAFPNCPGPLDASKAAFHGLALRPTQGKHYRLYSTQHGARESIEIFDVDATGATPTLTWIGCQPMPDRHPANSVVALGDGTILATVLIMPGKSFAESFEGKNTGAVFEWKPGSAAFRMIPGTELPTNNGIDVSADGREIYVASSGLRQIVVFSRESPAKLLRRGQLKDFTPDNVHWTADGKLIAAGMIDDEPACGGKPKADAVAACIETPHGLQQCLPPVGIKRIVVWSRCQRDDDLVCWWPHGNHIEPCGFHSEVVDGQRVASRKLRRPDATQGVA